MAHEAGTGLASLIAIKVICCGGLALLATGALSGFGAWLIAGGYMGIGGIAGTLLIGVALLLWRRRTRRDTAFERSAAWLLKGRHHGRVVEN